MARSHGHENQSDADYRLALAIQFGEEEDLTPGNVDQEQLDKDFRLAKAISETPTAEDFVVHMDPSRSVVDPQLDLTDPIPDVWELFRQFDARFFDGALAKNCVELSWAPKMTSCAGVCSWSPTTGFCSIRLSKPLLTLRPRSDLVETLIHEMIHAILFVSREDDNHESHGPKFHWHMKRINKEGKCNITVYHTFHDEVRHYQTHVWRCDGPCKNRHPYFGYVRRVMNRAPGPNDNWWSRHQSECSGSFIKISEPENLRKVPPKPLAKSKPPPKSPAKSIRDFFTPSPKPSADKTKKEPNKENPPPSSTSSTFTPFSGAGKRLGESDNNLQSRPAESGMIKWLNNGAGTLPKRSYPSNSTKTNSQRSIDVIELD